MIINRGMKTKANSVFIINYIASKQVLSNINQCFSYQGFTMSHVLMNLYSTQLQMLIFDKKLVG